MREPNTNRGDALTDCVVVGAGPAGLAASTALTERGVDHLVLERGRVGETWHTQRWDSFRLNTPGWMNTMLGGQAPDHYADRAEVVDRLDVLAASCPVRERTRVTGLAPAGEGYEVRTDGASFRARAVVVATGDQNVPRVPALAKQFPLDVQQCHTADYRAPDALPAGAVLVVGSGQSGCQIAEDLLAGGRRVFLATSAVGRAPQRHRGRATTDWLGELGFFDQRSQDLPDPSAVHAPQPILGAGGRSLSLQALARAGATLVGRPLAVDGDRVDFDGSTLANIAAGDAFAARARAMIDQAILRRGDDLPPAEPDEAEEPVDVDPPATVRLRDHEVTNIIWCTGFTGDFSWLPADLVGGDGHPLHLQTAAPLPGVWYVGLWWLVRRGSALFHGFPSDAATVAAAAVHASATRSAP